MAAFYILSSDPDLFSAAQKAVSSDGIDFRTIRKEVQKTASENKQLLCEIANNVFSWDSACRENPFWSLATLPARDYLLAWEAMLLKTRLTQCARRRLREWSHKMRTKGKQLRAAWEQQKQQQILRDQYGVSDPNTIVVERKNVVTNTLRLAGRASIMAIRFAASVALAGLALIGLAALIYPDTRLALLGHAVETMNQCGGDHEPVEPVVACIGTTVGRTPTTA